MRQRPRGFEDFLHDFYKIFVSPVFRTVFKGGCRFKPTCSEYSRQAYKKYGLIKGSALSVIRFFRCNPLSKHPREYPLE